MAPLAKKELVSIKSCNYPSAGSLSPHLPARASDRHAPAMTNPPQSSQSSPASLLTDHGFLKQRAP